MGLTTRLGEIHFTQSVASTSWVILHNLNTIAPVVDIWIDNNGSKDKFMPLSVVATDVNTCTVTFTVAKAGNAVVV